MVPEHRLQQIILGKDCERAMSSCMEHGYVESWVIMDGALIVYDPDDPPEWMKEAIASRDDDGNTPSFYKNHRGEQDRITCSGDVSW